MKPQYFFVFVFFIYSFASFSQETDSLTLAVKNGISKHSVLSAHPFGVFISRIQGNFKKTAVDNTTIKIGLESGNVWGTPIKTYIPNDEEIRNQVRDIEWHQAQYYFDEESLDAESYDLQIDGVLKGLRTTIELKLAKEHEINFGLRLFMLTKGKFPFSNLTSDEFIEFFHSNIGGGEDPFDRGVFGLNKAYIKYTDRNGNTMEIENGDVFIGGLETSYYYYPEFLINKNKNLNFNFGAHLGTNLSKYNSSIDIGLSSNAIKTFSISNNKNFQIGLSLGAIRKNAINFKDDNIDFGTNNFIGYLENGLEYSYVSKKGTIHSFGTNFYVQTTLNKKDEREYIIPIRHPEAHKAWGHGVTNLYEFNDYWTFLYSFTKKNTLTIYLQQDFTVSNNPDIQTGISYAFKI